MKKKMAPQKNNMTIPFMVIIIVILSPVWLVSCHDMRLHEEDDDEAHHHYNNYQEDEVESGGGGGYGLFPHRAYASYFSMGAGGGDEGSNFDNLARIGTHHRHHHLQGVMNRFVRLGAAASTKTINVVSYGAKGDGSSDDTKAFEDAWKEACSSSSSSSSTKVNFLVPGKNSYYLLKPIRLSGPCKSHITLQVSGTLRATADRSAYSKDSRHWIIIDGVDNLAVEGGGTIDGNGNIWWKNSCKVNKALPCKEAPTALTFYECKNLVVKNLRIQNAQQIHLSIDKCVNVQASNLKVTSPEESPNTDGIHVTNSQSIQISTSTIGTGDDCISIESGTKKLKASGITCGPGHGISIGSLGDGNSEAYVSDILVDGATLTGTTNGVRIKTYQGGSGSASNIKFQNVNMRMVKNPIIIDQNYCDQAKPCKEQESAVEVKNVVYENIKGTSASEAAIKFDCSKSFPCQGILLQNVELSNSGGGASRAECKNVKLSYSRTVSPRCSQES